MGEEIVIGEEQDVVDGVEAQVDIELEELKEKNKALELENERLELEVMGFKEEKLNAEKQTARKYISWLADRCATADDKTFLSMAIERCVYINGERI